MVSFYDDIEWIVLLQIFQERIFQLLQNGLFQMSFFGIPKHVTAILKFHCVPLFPFPKYFGHVDECQVVLTMGMSMFPQLKKHKKKDKKAHFDVPSNKITVHYFVLRNQIFVWIKFLLQFSLLWMYNRNLSNNKIADIEEGAFEGASGVNELLLTSNRLENIRHKMFKGLESLKTL